MFKKGSNVQYRVTIPGRAKDAAKNADRRLRDGILIQADTPNAAREMFRRKYGKKYKIRDDESIEVRLPNGEVPVSRPAPTRTTTYDDSTFVRTALIAEGEGGSVDVVTADGRRLCQINIFWSVEDESLIVDVIDVDDRYEDRKAVVFPKKGGPGRIVKSRSIVSADFRKRKRGEPPQEKP